MHINILAKCGGIHKVYSFSRQSHQNHDSAKLTKLSQKNHAATFSTPPPAPPVGQCLRDRRPVSTRPVFEVRLPSPKLWGGEKTPEKYGCACSKVPPGGQCLCDRWPVSTRPVFEVRLPSPKLWGGEKTPEKYGCACSKVPLGGQCLCDRRPVSTRPDFEVRLPSPKLRGGAGGGVEPNAKTCKIYFALLSHRGTEEISSVANFLSLHHDFSVLRIGRGFATIEALAIGRLRGGRCTRLG